ncbi:hypothetical protein [Streptomyces sp. NPDC093591]|uniref:hypothetical protein n=1 Tax=Streptomyces sp. NPDC093591 TaxID=3366044 RepID=UPI0038178290
MLFERERLNQLRLYAVDSLVDELTRQGSPALDLEAAHASVRIEPLRESAHRAAHPSEDNVVAGSSSRRFTHSDAVGS